MSRLRAVCAYRYFDGDEEISREEWLRRKHPDRRPADQEDRKEQRSKEARALEMRAVGVTFKAIGKELGVSASRARNIWVLAHRRMVRVVEEQRRIRLDPKLERFGFSEGERARIWHWVGMGAPDWDFVAETWPREMR